MVVAAIFMPLTLIRGIYGMSFGMIPELSWLLGYQGVVVSMSVISGAMLIYFRRRGWW
jgi:magnesium transporter